MIRIYLDGQLVLTTDQAVEVGNGRWKNPATLRAWISRHGIEAAAELNSRTKLYRPTDLGLEEPK